MYLEIAGIRINVCSQIDKSLVIPEKAYKAFAGDIEKPFKNEADVHLSLQSEPFPDYTRAKKVFDSGQSWSLYHDKEHYYIVLRHPEADKPYWLARINNDFSDGVVYLSKQMTSLAGEQKSMHNPVRYPLDQIILMHLLARQSGGIFHAAGINLDGKGYIFPGKSRAGKSTITRQFAQRKDFGLISDDRIVVRKMGSEFQAFGTPWPGEEGIAVNIQVPLCGIFFLNQGSANSIVKIDQRKAFEKLMPILSIPWYERETVDRLLEFCDVLTSSVQSYDIHFTPDTKITELFDKVVHAA